MAAVQKVSTITAKQRAADVANLKKARAALKGRPRTAKQQAASRRNIAVARAAQKARAAGKAPAAGKRPAAPVPDTWSRLDPGLHVLPVCGPVALAEHLLAATGTAASASGIITLWQAAEGTTLPELFEAARELGLDGNRLASFEPCDPDCGAPGLVYGIRLGRGYHAALSAPGGGMISWCRLLRRAGTPEEAWHLEWEHPAQTR